jgi:hypothetical protein
MGLTTKGFYTRGSKTSAEIGLMTGMVSGDTVFDTTRRERRVYDGFNWVSGNQISILSRGQNPAGANANQLVGACCCISDQNFSIQSGISTANDENIIGCLQGVNPLFDVAIGATGILQYRGMGFIANTTAVVNGNTIYADLASGVSRGRCAPIASPGIGTMGVFVETQIANYATKGIIQPIEIS